MLILFLDDEDARHELTEKFLSKEHEILHAFNVEEALKVIKSCPAKIGLAMLDHDLQDFYVEDNLRKEKTGVYFLQHMFNDIQKPFWPAQYILHSHNPPGAKNMYNDLIYFNQIVTTWPFSTDMLKHLRQNLKPQ